MMVGLDAIYPQYGFASHKGYGTPEHCEALDRYGPCPIHRRSFEPVRIAACARTCQPLTSSPSCSATSTSTPSIRSSTASCGSRAKAASARADGRRRRGGHAGGRAHRPEQPVRDGEVLSRGAGGGREADHRRRPARARAGRAQRAFDAGAAVSERDRLSQSHAAGQPLVPRRPATRPRDHRARVARCRQSRRADRALGRP